MKPTYTGFEAKKSNAFVELPTPGAYIGEIKAVRFLPKDEKKNQQRDQIEMMIDITEGEYAGRFMEVWEDQKEQWGDKVPYKGIFRLTPFVDGDEDWRKRAFEGNLWCVQESNPGYSWDWDEKKLKGKKIGISIRKRLYNYEAKDGTTKDGETVEIARFETVDDVRNGKIKPMKDRDTRKKKDDEESTDGSKFTDVSSDVDVPFDWAK